MAERKMRWDREAKRTLTLQQTRPLIGYLLSYCDVSSSIHDKSLLTFVKLKLYILKEYIIRIEMCIYNNHNKMLYI